MADIVKEMRKLADEPIITAPEGRAMLRVGADEIDRLRAENGLLRREVSQIPAERRRDANKGE